MACFGLFWGRLRCYPINSLSLQMNNGGRAVFAYLIQSPRRVRLLGFLFVLRRSPACGITPNIPIQQ